MSKNLLVIQFCGWWSKGTAWSFSLSLPNLLCKLNSALLYLPVYTQLLKGSDHFCCSAQKLIMLNRIKKSVFMGKPF